MNTMERNMDGKDGKYSKYYSKYRKNWKNVKIAVILSLPILMLLIPLAYAVPLEGRSYLVSMHYKNGKIQDTTVSLADSDAPTSSFVSGPAFTVTLSSRGKKLFSRSFVVPGSLEVLPLPGKEFGPYAPLDDVRHSELVPYFTEGTDLTITDPAGNVVQEGSINLTRFVLCNLNNRCDDRESSEICPQDCKPGEEGAVKKFIEGKTITPNEAKDWNLPLESDGQPHVKAQNKRTSVSGPDSGKDSQDQGGPSSSSWMSRMSWGWLAFVVIVIIGILFWRKKAKEPRSSKKKDRTT